MVWNSTTNTVGLGGTFLLWSEIWLKYCGKSSPHIYLVNGIEKLEFLTVRKLYGQQIHIAIIAILAYSWRFEYITTKSYENVHRLKILKFGQGHSGY